MFSGHSTGLLINHWMTGWLILNKLFHINISGVSGVNRLLLLVKQFSYNDMVCLIAVLIITLLFVFRENMNLMQKLMKLYSLEKILMKRKKKKMSDPGKDSRSCCFRGQFKIFCTS